MCLDAIFCRLFVVAPVVVVLDEARDLVQKRHTYRGLRGLTVARRSLLWRCLDPALAIFRSALSKQWSVYFPCNLQPSSPASLAAESADSRPIELIASMGH